MSSEKPRGSGAGRRGRCDVLTSLTRGLEDLSLAEAHRRIALGPPGRPDLYVPRWHRTLVFVLVGAMAASLVVVGIALRQPGVDHLDVGTTAPIDTPLTLEQLAAVARSQPSLALDRENPYVHLVADHIPSETQRVDGLIGWREERWIAADGSGRVRTRELPGGAPLEDPIDETLGIGELTVAGLVPAELMDLPSDPAALLTALGSAIGERVRPEHIASLLVLPTPAPELRVGLVEALGRLGVAAVDAPSDDGARFSARVGEETVEITFDRLTAHPTVLHVSGPDPSVAIPARTTFRLAEVSARAG